jgi:hypothetical protein
MHLVFNILGRTLLAGLVAAALAPSMLPAPTGTHQRPAGCHEHSRKAPTSSPVSYRCCQTGHGAILRQEFPGFPPQVLGGLPESAALDLFPAPMLVSDVRYRDTSPGGPPGNFPQRI